MKAFIPIYVEEGSVDVCDKCCFSDTCAKEEYCLCDTYPKTIGQYDSEGIYYFQEVEK